MVKNKLVVYTCITGGYDTLREIRYKSPNIDYVCFTDNAKLTSKTWLIKPLPDEIASEKSIVKKQRLIKLLPHKWFSEYDASLWIDSNIEIIGDLIDFFSKYDLSKKFLYVNKHPSRDCIYREQLAIIRLNKDTFENTTPQINRYREEGFPEHYGLAETNILLRKHGDKRCIKLMNAWADEIKKGSHRDQLSFNYCVWKCDCKSSIEYLDEKYYNLHVSDNAFFCLRRHVNIGKIDAFLPVKTIDTKETVKKEEHVKVERTDVLTKEEKKDPSKKPVSVVVFTHDRTNVARETLKSLFRNLKYSGELNWILADDRSTKEHLAELNAVFAGAGVKYELCQTTKTRFGLGASMNIGLQKAFKKSDIVLRVEDDWILEKRLELDRFVKTLEENDNVAGIRMGMIGGGVNIGQNLFKDSSYKVLVGPNDSSWLFVNQVAIVHRRIHNSIGWYKENVSADKSEEEFRTRFNRATENGRKTWLLLVPNEMKWRTFDDPSLWFIHIGRSTLGHTIYREPKRYSWIYDNEAKMELKKEKDAKQMDNEKLDLIVSMTTYKPRLLQKNTIKVLRAILEQKTKRRFKIVMTIYKDDEKYIWPELSAFMRKNGIDIIIAEKNLRPHLKYFYAMQKYRNLPIVTIDDDCVYSSDLLDSLYLSYLKHPDCVSARRVHCIRYFRNGRAMKYNDWLYEYKKEMNPSQDLFATGVGGVLYPPDSLKISGNDASYILENCLTNDDLFLKKRENDLGVKTVYVKSKTRSYVSLSASIEKHALSVSDNITNNDKIIERLAIMDISKKKPLTKSVNLCYILDEDYTVPTIASINSLRKNRSLDVVYYIFLICEGISLNSYRAIKKLEDRDFYIIFISNPGNIAKYDFKQVNKIPKTACYKFFLDKLLVDIDKVLYIDGDTIILKDLYSMYSTNIDDKYCAAIKDFKVCKKYAQPFFKELVKKNNGYFNSGVMLLNLRKIREDNITQKLVLYRLNGVNCFADQDALNVCFDGKVKYLSPSCNFIASNLLFSSDEIKKFYEEDGLPKSFSEVESNKIITIYHITGIDKPWKMKTSKAYKTFSKYMA